MIKRLGKITADALVCTGVVVSVAVFSEYPLSMWQIITTFFCALAFLLLWEVVSRD